MMDKKTQEFQDLVHFVLGFQKNPSFEELQKFIRIISYFQSISPLWLKRILTHQQMFQYWGDIERLLMAIHPVTKIKYKVTAAVNDDIFLTKEKDKTSIRKSNIVPNDLIYEDIEFLLKQHFGPELTQIFKDCFDFKPFIHAIIAKAEIIDYESIIAEYLADKNMFGKDLFIFTEPSNTEVG